jgi:hypothetical protein
MEAAMEVLVFVILSFVFLSLLLPVSDFMEDFYEMYALTSAEVVARDLANLITISFSAPGDVDVSYEVPFADYCYDVDIRGREVAVRRYTLARKPAGETSYPIALDLSGSATSSREFLIEKRDQEFNFEGVTAC